MPIYGKVQVIKSLFVPKFTYLFHSLIVPKDIVKVIKSMLFKFLWDNKQEKIKRATLIGDKLQGGINMLDIDSFITSLKLKWVRNWTENTKANWKLIANYFLKDFGENFLIFFCNIDIKYLILNKVTEFYETRTYNFCNDYNTMSFEQIRNQIIWGNKFIKRNKKCLFFKSWINSNNIFEWLT